MGPKVRTVKTSLNVDTSALAAGDLCATTNALLTGCVQSEGMHARLIGLTIFDPADQTAGTYVGYILNQDASMGAMNSAPTITDLLAQDAIEAVFEIPTARWIDAGGIKVATLNETDQGFASIVKCLSGSKNLWFNLVSTNATPTFTAPLLCKFRFQELI